MIRRSRRRVLKGVAVSLPVSWATPVVQLVATPVHAQTSECDLFDNCYGAGEYGTFFWPGGGGVQNVPFWAPAPDSCFGEPDRYVDVAAARSEGDARSMLGCGAVIEVNLPGQECNLFFCT